MLFGNTYGEADEIIASFLEFGCGSLKIIHSHGDDCCDVTSYLEGHGEGDLIAISGGQVVDEPLGIVGSHQNIYNIF